MLIYVERSKGYEDDVVVLCPLSGGGTDIMWVVDSSNAA